MKIVLFGAPGCGKGTQAKLISGEFNIPQISTGDILRKHISDKTEIGELSKNLIDNGQLVPDNVIIKIIKERISQPDCQKGYILDGFPRTYEQAIQFEKIDKINAVIYIDITINEVEKRAINRRICPVCGKIFNIADRYIEKCDCGEKLIQRDDDKIHVVRKRIDTYLSQSKPLIEYYRKKKTLFRVLSGDTPQETYKEVKKILLTIEKSKKRIKQLKDKK